MSMTSRLPVCSIGLLSLCIAASLYYAALDTVATLSPQGCRMSWMSPSYLLQSGFDRTWSPLASRYSLWLYREVGWEGHELRGTPVLFIPGNAGSSHQVRSIASSATRQYYSNPYEVAHDFHSKALKPLDFFAVEFNEDLSAFHGTTIDAQREYTLRAIDYILSLYPADTSVIVMGHSMGGVVGTALLPHPKISAVITMSTPHTLPPARFDRRIDRIYSMNRKVLLNDTTPILSLCGGATDLMIPSESCILPQVKVDEGDLQPYRRTIFSSALEGSWTGVGHREMVWCHQVRWRIARAALELGAATSPRGRETILDTWIRDGNTPPATYQTPASPFYPDDTETLPLGMHLSLKNPMGSHTYLLPVPNDATAKYRFLLYVSQGSIPPTSPHNPLPLRASVYFCDATNYCRDIKPAVLKLVPNPLPGKLFPVPDEGSDESEGVVVLEADLPRIGVANVAVRVENGDGRGWISGAFLPAREVVVNSTMSTALFSKASAETLPSALRMNLNFPRLLSNSLIVYKVVPTISKQCTGTLLSPLLQYTSHPFETHYFPLAPNTAVFLHTHASAPFVPSVYTHGLNLTIYNTGEGGCSVERIELSLDIWATLGRWGVRYAGPAASWAIGVVGILLYDAWKSTDILGTVPSVGASLATFVRRRLPILLVLSTIMSLLPLPTDMWLGNNGEWTLAAIAPTLLFAITGLVAVSWLVILVMMWPLRILSKRFASRHPVVSPPRRMSSVLSLCLICTSIFLLIPWQVGFLGCWVYHLYTCASFQSHRATPDTVAIPLIPRGDEVDDSTKDHDPSQPSPTPASLVLAKRDSDAQNQSDHLLLLMTWLLPLAAPVLAVWVRTLFTAGFTTPFDGDHNVLYVVPFLILVDPSWGRSWMWSWHPGILGISTTVQPRPRWTMLILVVVTLLWGARYAYIVFEATSVILGCGLFVSFLRK